MELSVSLDLHWGEKLFFPQSPRTIASEGYCFWFLLQSDPTFFFKKKNHYGKFHVQTQVEKIV